MKKKLVLTSFLTTLFSLLALLLTSVFLVDHYRKVDAEKSLENYLSISMHFYDPDSTVNTPNATKNLLANQNSEVRLTIVSSTGQVKVDTSPDVSENHLSRPEIQNPGTIVYRYSETLGEKMVYLAGVDVGSASSRDYVRVAFSIKYVQEVTINLAIYGSIGVLAITLLATLLTWLIISRSLKPLQKQVNDLSVLVDEPITSKDDIAQLGSRVEKAGQMLNDRYEDIAKEKQKYELLLDQLEQGIIAFNDKKEVVLLNKAAATTFLTTQEEALHKDYRFFSTNELFQKNLEKAFEKGQSSSMDLTIGAKTYLLNITSLCEGFSEHNRPFGAAIFSLDVTEKRKLEATKRDFFANASHELKSPLTSIIGYQELLDNGTLASHDEIVDATTRTLKEANRMKDIIASMLILAKLEGNLPSPHEVINLKDTVNSVLESYKIPLQEKKLKLEISLEDCSLKMDPTDAYNLVKNLVENAIKYNNDKGLLLIRLRKDSLLVKDSGIGIAKENQSRIYERFYRVDPSRNSTISSTGLGLSIVKHICLSYNFKISLVSELGQGSSFTVLFE